MSQASDVSNWQGQVDWQAEKAAGVALGICKASEGTGFTDPTFAANWAGIKAAGMLRGAYHYVHPGNNVGAEVGKFLSVVRSGGLETTDTLWMDFEDKGSLAGAAVPQWGVAWMAELDRQRPDGRNGVYTGRWFVDATGGPGAWAGMARWPYWFSAYQSNLPSAQQLAPWGSCVLWQNTSSQRIAGVHGVCDSSIIENGGFFTALTQGDPDMAFDDAAKTLLTEAHDWAGQALAILNAKDASKTQDGVAETMPWAVADANNRLTAVEAAQRAQDAKLDRILTHLGA